LIFIIALDYLRWMYARNWDDFLQRDCKAFTFPRALAIWAAASLGFATGKKNKEEHEMNPGDI